MNLKFTPSRVLFTGLFLLFTYFSFGQSFQHTISEDFKGPKPANFEVGDEAYFTSGAGDPVGDGWLRLTRDSLRTQGFAYLNQAFPAGYGFTIDFEFKTWRTHGSNFFGGDGISVFLFDGKYGPDAPDQFAMGAYGGGLGYANRNPGTPTPSLTGGYIGLGIDEFGNYSNANEGKNGGTAGVRRNAIALRGKTTDSDAFSTTTTPFLAGVGINKDFTTIDVLTGEANSGVSDDILDYNTIVSSRPDDTVFYRRIQISVVPINNGGTTNYRIIVKMAHEVGGEPVEVLNYDYAEAPYSTLKLGFGASTGGNYNIHEIRNLRISYNSSIHAVPDINQTPGGIAVSGNVLTNDINDDIDQLAVSRLSVLDGSGAEVNVAVPSVSGATTDVYALDGSNNPVLAGSISINSDGSYTFTPEDGFIGNVPMKYLGANAQNEEETTLTIKVIPIVDATNQTLAPVANGDQGYTVKDISLTGNILNNDSDPDGAPGQPDYLVVSSASIGVNSITPGTSTQVSGKTWNDIIVADAGSITINADGSYTYVPAQGFEGIVDPITYSILDADGLSDQAILNISIFADGSRDNTVYAQDDANSGSKGVTLSGVLLENDFDAGGFTLSVTELTYWGQDGSQHTVAPNSGTPINIYTASGTFAGQLSSDDQGNYTFVPDNAFVGTVPVIYTATNDNPAGSYSAQATLYLTTIDVDKVLPVTLAGFEAVKQGNRAVLSWSTATEQNNAGFEPERSPDGQNWSAIGFVASKSIGGNSNMRLNYQFTDNNPEDGINYYRLHQKDLDGNSSFSEVRTLNFDGAGVVSIYPNPVRTTAIVRGLSGNETIRIYNDEGRMVRTEKVNSKQTTINFSNLSRGTYRVQVISANGKLVKTLSVLKVM